MILPDLSLKHHYESDEDDMLRSFYIPILSCGKEYWRASGYFSASSFFYAAQGFSKLIYNQGRIKLILGCALNNEDFNAISLGYDKRKEKTNILQKEFKFNIENTKNDLFAFRMQALIDLIEAEKIDIKIAYRKQGIYHKKFGLLFDNDDNVISFNGSNNETSQAWLPEKNSEELTVYKSWDDSLKPFIETHKKDFLDTWNDSKAHTKVYTFEEAEKKQLIDIVHNQYPDKISLSEEEIVDTFFYSNKPNSPKVPETLNGKQFEIKNHQKIALEKWQENNFVGIFELATGAGKTITSIYGLTKIFENYKQMFVLIAVPYQNLADQWAETLKLFNISAIECYRSRKSWEKELLSQVSDYRLEIKKFCCAIVVNKTFNTEHFKNIIQDINQNFLFIGDECHHHSTDSYKNALPLNANWRMGLSATPFHYINEKLNENLKSYFGNVIYKYSLEDAIRDDVLCKYYYHIIPVKLTEEETEEYSDLSYQISQIISSSDIEENTYLKSLLLKRSRLLSSASNKIIELRKLLQNLEPSPYSLFYCGDGRVDDVDISNDDENMRQIEQVVRVVNNYKWYASKFTSEESKVDRENILSNFKNGDIKSMVAIKCLDEGIDIPDCKRAFFLASSNNPRQFIQRRGRILRKSPNKDFAHIYDFMVFVPNELSSNKYDKRLLQSELKRVSEFTKLSENEIENYTKLRPILKDYDLEGLL